MVRIQIALKNSTLKWLTKGVAIFEMAVIFVETCILIGIFVRISDVMNALRAETNSEECLEAINLDPSYPKSDFENSYSKDETSLRTCVQAAFENVLGEGKKSESSFIFIKLMVILRIMINVFIGTVNLKLFLGVHKKRIHDLVIWTRFYLAYLALFLGFSVLLLCLIRFKLLYFWILSGVGLVTCIKYIVFLGIVILYGQQLTKEINDENAKAKLGNQLAPMHEI